MVLHAWRGIPRVRNGGIRQIVRFHQSLARSYQASGKATERNNEGSRKGPGEFGSYGGRDSISEFPRDPVHTSSGQGES